MHLDPQPVSPLSCYALEHDASMPRCRACAHVTACTARMGHREGRVTLDRVRPRFLPGAFGQKLPGLADEAYDLQSTYDLCYQQVFGGVSGQSVGRFGDKILCSARKARCEVRLFILMTMLGHQQAWPDKLFTPGLLASGRVRHSAEVYGAAARKLYGAVTDASLDNLLRSDAHDFEIHRRLEDAEVLAGAWIIGYRLFQDGLPYSPMFLALETDLDSNWLALEPHYQETFSKHLLDPGEMNARRAHRHCVASVTAKFKRHRQHAIGNFRARERAFIPAVRRVLEKFYYAPEDFETLPDVTDAMRFWNRLGLAVQHYECLKCVRGQPSVYGTAEFESATQIPRHLLMPYELSIL